MKRALLLTIATCLLHSIHSQIVNPDFIPTIEGLPEIFVVKNFSNDKVLVSGEITSVGDVPINRTALLNADGSLDEGFATNVVGSVYDALYDAQNDKYYIGGVLDGDDLIRLNSDGTIDETFLMDTELFVVNHLDLQSDGKLIVISNTSQLGIVRLNSDGSLDDTFDNNAGFNSVSYLNSELKILSDDKILFGGTFTSYNSEAYSHLIKLNADGSVDETFDFQGNLTASGSIYISSILPLTGGDIIVAGNFDTIYGNSAKSLGRLNTDGSFDDTFTLPGPGGSIFNNAVNAVLDQSENIIAAGLNTTIDGYAVLRLDSDGNLDTDFTVGSIDYSNAVGYIQDPTLAISSSNEIYYSSFHTEFDGHFSQGLTKLDASGQVITTYAPDIAGKSEIDVAKYLSDGSVLVGGLFTAVNNEPFSYLAKLSGDGTIDADFMGNIGNGPDRRVFVIKEDNNQNILVGGGFTEFDGAATGALVRLAATGVRDVTFDPEAYPKFVGPGVHDIFVADNDQILIGGILSTVDGLSRPGLAKINNDGTLDQTFDLGLDADAHIIDIQMFQDGSFLYAGNIAFGSGVLVGKIDAAGNADMNFSVTYDFTNLELLTATLMTGTDDILLSTITSNDYNLVQLQSDGTLTDDLSVGVSGSSGISTILPLDETSILIGGQFSQVNGATSPGFAKVSLSGGVDNQYNFGLVEIGNFSGPSVNTIIDLGDDNYLISGNFSKVDNQDVTSIAIINTQTPKSPSDLDGNFTYSDGIILNWEDNATTESSYEVYRKDGDGEYSMIGTTTANQTTFTDSNVSLGSTYTYKVSAANETYSSSYSPEFQIETDDLPAPSDISFEFDYAKGTTISWTYNSGLEESVQLYRSAEGAEFELLAELTADDVSYEDVEINLTASYEYYLRITAGLFESQSEAAPYTTPGSALLPTPEISITMVDDVITLNWQYEFDQILGFEVHRSEISNDNYESISETTENTYADANAQKGENFYRIRSFNAFEYSEFSNEVNMIILSVLNPDDLQMYPNPASSDFQIQSDREGKGFEVINMDGKVLMLGELNQKVDVRNLTNGIYLVKIYTKDGAVIRKLVIKGK